MHSHFLVLASTALVLLSTSTLAAVNGPCKVGATPGVCISTSSCGSGGGTSTSGYCPNDPADIKCCTKPSCGSGGNCRFTSDCTGTPKSGLCPGPSSFQCCEPKSQTTPGGSGTPGPWSLSDSGTQFIAGFEGFRADFYTDAVGVKTIGYGHACQPASSCDNIRAPITQAQGRDLLKSDAGRFVSCLNSLVRVSLNQNQVDALVSFAFNTGCGSLGNIAQNLNANDFPGATERMKLYNKGNGQVIPGLTRRRQAEVDLFNS